MTDFVETLIQNKKVITLLIAGTLVILLMGNASMNALAVSFSPETGAESAGTDAESPETGAESPETGAESAETDAESPETGAESVETGAESAESVPASGQDDSDSGETAPQESGSIFNFWNKIPLFGKILFIVSASLILLLTVCTWFDTYASFGNLLENPLWILSCVSFVVSLVIIAVSILYSAHWKAQSQEDEYVFEENAAVVYIDYEENPPTTLTMTGARKFITNEGAVNIIANYRYIDERGDIKYQLSIVLDGDMFLDKTYNSKNKDDRSSHPASFDLKIRGTQYVTAKKAKKSSYVVEITDRSADLTHYQGQFSVVAQRTREKPGVWLFNCWEVIPPKTVYVKETVTMKGTFDFSI